MIENQPKLAADWPGWPGDDDLAAYNEVDLTSRPGGTEVEERFPPEVKTPLPEVEEAPPADYPVEWDFDNRHFTEPSMRYLLQALCERDGLPQKETSRPDSRAVILGEERRLPFQPGVPLWVLAFRESVSRSRSWGPAQAARARLAGAFYRSFLRAAYLEPDKEWPEAADALLEQLYKSPADHGNGRSVDAGDRPDIPDYPRDWCGAAVSWALCEGLRRAGWRLKLADDWSPLVYRKDWNLDVTEYANGGLPKTIFSGDDNPEPLARAGDILTLIVHNPEAPPTGHYALVLAAKMTAPQSGLVYVASGSTGPMRTVAVDCLRIEPRDPAFKFRYVEGPRPTAGSAWILELNRTSLVQPSRRLKLWSKDQLAQLAVQPLR